MNKYIIVCDEYTVNTSIRAGVLVDKIKSINSRYLYDTIEYEAKGDYYRVYVFFLEDNKEVE